MNVIPMELMPRGMKDLKKVLTVIGMGVQWVITGFIFGYTAIMARPPLANIATH